MNLRLLCLLSVEIQDWSQDFSRNWSVSVLLFYISSTANWLCFPRIECVTIAL